MDTFLGRALTDPATGLPNLPYFSLIQNWEERRARRRRTLVRVIRLHVAGGDEAARRSLMWRLCQELRTSDLIASEGRDEFRILLTSPDAENVEAIAERVRAVVRTVNSEHGAGSNEGPLAVVAKVEEPSPPEGVPKGPCDPCEDHELLGDQSAGAEWSGGAGGAGGSREG